MNELMITWKHKWIYIITYYFRNFRIIQWIIKSINQSISLSFNEWIINPSIHPSIHSLLPRLLMDILYKVDPMKILNLRLDSLSQILNMVNVHRDSSIFFSKFFIFIYLRLDSLSQILNMVNVHRNLSSFFSFFFLCRGSQILYIMVNFLLPIFS